MGNHIKRLRLKARVAEAAVAADLGITVTHLSQFERNWNPMPVSVVRDLALLFECSASEVLGAEIPVTEWKDSSYAAGPEAREVLYGSLGFWAAGKKFDFPISRGARESMLRQPKTSWRLWSFRIMPTG